MQTLTRRSERVQFELHRAVVTRLHTDPAPVISKGLGNLDKIREKVHGPQARRWVDDWERALLGPVDGLIDLCLRTDEYGADMRQVTPFAGVLTEDERLDSIRRARQA